MHPLVFLGLIMVAGIFAGLGALVLWLTPWPGLRWASLIWFVFSAVVGGIAYVFAFEAITGRINGGFGSSTSETFFVLSIPLVGSLVGWLGAAAAALLFRRNQ